MGSESSKYKHHVEASKYGQIYIQTDKVAYYSGEQITGRVYVNMLTHYPAKQIHLKIKGKENAFWIDTRREKHHHEDHYRDVDYLMEEKHDIIKALVPIYTWEDLGPGQFIIPFNFLLPQNLPSSFSQEGHKYHAHVAYQLEAIIEPSDHHHPKLKYKQPIIVRQPISTDFHHNEQEIETHLTTCCCLDKGSNKLHADFEKNYYYPGEIARVNVRLDNSHSKLRNNRISFIFKQSLKIHALGKTFHKEFRKVEKDLAGIPAGATGETMEITLELPMLQQVDLRTHKHSDMKHHLLHLEDKHDHFMHPATRSHLITSEYFLEICCDMEGCCSPNPDIRCPVEVFHPDVQREVVVAPSGWNPRSVEPVNVSFGYATVNAPEKPRPSETATSSLIQNQW